MPEAASARYFGAPAVLVAISTLILVYLVNLNRLLSRVPPTFQRLIPKRWTEKDIKETYDRLLERPITTASYAGKIPPRLNRRYIVTGGSGLVGGCIVLQLLERGEPPSAIRIVDFQEPHRADMLRGPATEVDFRKADISSAEATHAAFSAPWDRCVAVDDLPLTVFHTAAVIIPSARSQLVNGFCEAVNVRGTENVVAAARAAGADVLVSTSSASIGIRPIEFWSPPWRRCRWNQDPKHYAQVLDESDFFCPIRPHQDFFGNYPASKAKAERIVCGANGRALRTGCIRPANGVYGHPTDNLIGAPLNMQTYPQWVDHIIQSFVHGINCALAHLQFEAVLARPDAHALPQAGRPFCVTDPCEPIYYRDLYNVISSLAVTPFRVVRVPPLPMLLLSYAVEFYNLLPARLPSLSRYLPRPPGDVVYLEPGLFSICTHLVGDMRDACRPVDRGGLGYEGVLTTLEGMCQELLEWNREQEEHRRDEATRLAPGSNSDGGLSKPSGGPKADGKRVPKYYRNSVSLAEEIRKLGGLGKAMGS